MKLPIIYFDFETSENEKKRHIPYHLSYGFKVENGVHVIRSNGIPPSEMITGFLRQIANKLGHTKKEWDNKWEKVLEEAARKRIPPKMPPDVLLFAHNSTYDATFLLPYLKNVKILQKDGRYVSIEGSYSGLGLGNCRQAK
jgi:hypothetical protein